MKKNGRPAPEKRRQMHSTSASVFIDPAQCTGCGTCIRVCPSDILCLENGTAHAAPDTNAARCLQCGHCMAACPENAVTIPALDPDLQDFTTFTLDPAWLAPGKGLPTFLGNKLMKCQDLAFCSIRTDYLEDFTGIRCAARPHSSWSLFIVDACLSVS